MNILKYILIGWVAFGALYMTGALLLEAFIDDGPERTFLWFLLGVGMVSLWFAGNSLTVAVELVGATLVIGSVCYQIVSGEL